ncbi:hypothetical protein EVAR_54097_1 [Eumeta japonica]|uniref:Uncharacterized protein n=1 Tax=Eumeta variegata TaxID=151549 RepID=A0A4C1Z1L3_EUMVA|nr:hypothetical protein EVAR_54097_1 [Eumeta japonica]
MKKYHPSDRTVGVQIGGFRRVWQPLRGAGGRVRHSSCLLIVAYSEGKGTILSSGVLQNMYQFGVSLRFIPATASIEKGQKLLGGSAPPYLSRKGCFNKLLLLRRRTRRDRTGPGSFSTELDHRAVPYVVTAFMVTIVSTPPTFTGPTWRTWIRALEHKRKGLRKGLPGVQIKTDIVRLFACVFGQNNCCLAFMPKCPAKLSDKKMSSVQEETAEGTAKTRTHELRNAELVSRLLAATPPYLYSALPLQPHAFSSAKCCGQNEDPPPPAPPTNSWQRRDWHRTAGSEQRFHHDPFGADRRQKPSFSETRIPETGAEIQQPGPPNRPSSLVDVGTEDLPKPAPCAANVPPSNLILPPPPPMWYPPIYNPQFGVDPLNFFIDLRVSGHIYDRKRAVSETIETNVGHEVRNEESIEKRLGRDLNHRPRHVSAFSVPVKTTKVCVDAPAQYFDHSNPKVSGKVNGTSYIMRNLKRVYEHVRPIHDAGPRAEKSKPPEDHDTKTECSDVEEDVVE